MNSFLERKLPYDIDAEHGLCAACMINPPNMDAVAFLEPGELFDQAAAKLYGVLHLNYRCRKPIDDIRSVVAELKDLGVFEEVGGLAFLQRLFTDAPAHQHHAVYYAKRIRRLARLRKIIEHGQQMLQEAFDEGADPDAIASLYQARLARIDASEDDKPRFIGAISTDVLQDLDTPENTRAMVFSGIADLDTLCGPWLGGELIILAARTSIGKTAMALQMAIYHGDKDRTALVASLEMQQLELVQRILCADAAIDSRAIRAHDLGSGNDRRNLINSANRFSPSKVMVWAPKGRRTVDRIAAVAQRTQAEHGLELLVVDYLQLVEPEDRRTKRYEAIGAITRDLKSLAGDLGVPVLCLAQLNRQADKPKTLPTLAMLRESGEIEQHADAVLLLHREKREDAKTILLVAKHRYGQTGHLPMLWNGLTQTFTGDCTPERIAEFDAYNESRDDWEGYDEFPR